MFNLFPKNTSVTVKLDKLIRQGEKAEISEMMSARMAKCVSSMNENEFIGWQMNVYTKGLTDMYLFGSESICKSDLEWIAENTAKCSGKIKADKKSDKFSELYEISIVKSVKTGKCSIGFGNTQHEENYELTDLPLRFSSQFPELVRVLQTTGAVFRAVTGKADSEEQLICKNRTAEIYCYSNYPQNEYTGRPVKTRVLLRLPSSPTIRLKTVIEEAVNGCELRYIGSMNDSAVSEIWDNPVKNAPVLPEHAARIMLMQPWLSESMTGIEVADMKSKDIPATHKNTKSSKAVTIGKATDITGVSRKITIGDMDLKRHYQIVGQTGTGKSTMLSQLILNAIAGGYGLTFFDPHGTTIDTILRALPSKYAKRVRVVRLGDAEHPVPLNMWDSGDPQKEEKTISELCELFSDIFDPKREGFVGPRYERWLSLFLKASLAFLGRRASFESITVLSRSRENMKKLVSAIQGKYPQLAESIKEEYANNNSPDFNDLISWFLCKFQRLTSVKQLRRTLGAGANALDFKNTIDTDTVTLIDLASPVIGTNAARIAGTLTMMKLWNAALERKERDRTHIIVVDEAALFQTNPMPRMLAESRKFGISMVLCHQHEGQLTQVIRDALEANSANFSAFRLSPKDAYLASVRFDDEKLSKELAGLDAFKAVTSISVDGIQSAPFTLRVEIPKKQKNGEHTAEMIEKRSINELVEHYSNFIAYTQEDIQSMLDHYDEETYYPDDNIEDIDIPDDFYGFEDDDFYMDDEPEWLKEWNNSDDDKATA